MAIIGYILVFVLIGFFIGAIANDQGKAITIIVVISILWAFAAGPWGIVTFIELMIGYYLSKPKINTL